MVGDPGLAHLERLTAAARIACTEGACHHAARVPTYDYQCRSCGRIIEVIHSMLEDGPSTCDSCGGQLRRVFHPTGIIFRGSGFYKTDSRPAGSGSGVGKPAKAAASGDGAGPGGGGAGEGGSAAKGESGTAKPESSSTSSSSAGGPAGEGG